MRCGLNKVQFEQRVVPFRWVDPWMFLELWNVLEAEVLRACLRLTGIFIDVFSVMSQTCVVECSRSAVNNVHDRITQYKGITQVNE